jgi:hypothetical protein
VYSGYDGVYGFLATQVNSAPPTSPPPEISFQQTSGQLAVWQMNGTTFVGGGGIWPNPGPTWFATGKDAFYTGDTSDVVWQEQNGAVAISQIQGTQAVGGAFVGNPGPSWHVKGTGNFNNDGHADIVWQNDDGSVTLWEMNGATFVGGGWVANLGPTWHMALISSVAAESAIPDRAGTSKALVSSITTATPTSCGRTTMAGSQSGR